MSAELTAELKKFARAQGADLVGIGSMDRFEGAPVDCDPRFIMPEATHMVGLAFRIHRGNLRGIEEGTHFGAYSTYDYSLVNKVHQPLVCRQVASFIEDHGFEAFTFGNSIVRMGTNVGRPVRPGYPRPDVFLHVRIACYICGLGEIGWSKVFLTPEFGPRQRLAFLITDAPLDADPIYAGPKLCNRCYRCVSDCPVGAIPKDESVKVEIAGKELEWCKLDQHRCGLGWQAAVPERNPHADEGVRGAMREMLEDMDARPFEERQDEVWQPRNRLGKIFHYTRNGDHYFRHPGAICGGRGCIRSCMVSLEDRDVLANKFARKFRRRPEWILEDDDPELAAVAPPDRED